MDKIENQKGNPLLAVKYRLQALALAWRSTASWHRHDAETLNDESEATALRRSALEAELCASNLEAVVREWPTKYLSPK